MIHKKTRLLRMLARVFALVLLLSMMLVGCEEETPKRNFPDFDANSIGGNSTSKNNSNNNSNANDNSYTTGGNGSSSGKKRVAITYDDGPHIERTKAIADELAKYGFHATFFVVGNRVNGDAYSGGEAVKYVASKGNEIAIHAYTHSKYYDTCSDQDYKNEIKKTSDAILEKLPNAKIRLMRPVGGRITAERTEACDYSVVMWSVDSNDWRYKNSGDENVKAIVDNVMSSVRDGSIILMHDIYENTYLATKEILKQLNAQGYEVVTVSQLLGNPRPGVKYSKAQ